MSDSKKKPSADSVTVRYNSKNATASVTFDPAAVDIKVLTKGMANMARSNELPDVFAKATGAQVDSNSLRSIPKLLKGFKTDDELASFLELQTERYQKNSEASGIITLLKKHYDNDYTITNLINNIKDRLDKNDLLKEQANGFFVLVLGEEGEEDDLDLELEIEKFSNVKFKDIGGMNQIRGEMRAIVECIKNPERIIKLGGSVPKSVLLSGPTGTGKTLLVKALAGESGIPLVHINAVWFRGENSLDSSNRVKKVFNKVKDLVAEYREIEKNASCILFIENIDAIGRCRSDDIDIDKDDTILYELLAHIDGFSSSEGVIVFAETNLPDVLDSALVARFERSLDVQIPVKSERLDILKILTKEMFLAKEVKFHKLAEATDGLSGAELEKLVKEATMNTIQRNNARTISAQDFDNALEKVLMGSESGHKMIDEEEEFVAVHEAGHAIVNLRLEQYGVEKLKTASILPRTDGSLGMTLLVGDKERHLESLNKQKADLATDLGGRIAEEEIYGPDGIKSSADSDIENATETAEYMIMKSGFNEKVGPVNLGDDIDMLDYKTGRIVREETKKLINEACDRARQILKKDRGALIALAKELLIKKTMDREQIIKASGINPKPYRKLVRLKHLKP